MVYFHRHIFTPMFRITKTSLVYTMGQIHQDLKIFLRL